MSNKSGTSSQAVSLPTGGGALPASARPSRPTCSPGPAPSRCRSSSRAAATASAAADAVYSTGNGNGPFGLGWASRRPALRRKTAKGVPRYRRRTTRSCSPAGGPRAGRRAGGRRDALPPARRGAVRAHRPRLRRRQDTGGSQSRTGSSAATDRAAGTRRRRRPDRPRADLRVEARARRPTRSATGSSTATGATRRDGRRWDQLYLAADPLRRPRARRRDAVPGHGRVRLRGPARSVLDHRRRASRSAPRLRCRASRCARTRTPAALARTYELATSTSAWPPASCAATRCRSTASRC